MIRPGPGTRIWLACGFTDMRRGFDGLAALVQSQLEQDPFSGQLFVFRGRKGDRVKLLWWDGDGLCLLAKRLENGRFIWPQASEGSVVLTAAQLAWVLSQLTVGSDSRIPAGVTPVELRAFLEDLVSRLTRLAYPATPSP